MKQKAKNNRSKKNKKAARKRRPSLPEIFDGSTIHACAPKQGAKIGKFCRHPGEHLVMLALSSASEGEDYIGMVNGRINRSPKRPGEKWVAGMPLTFMPKAKRFRRANSNEWINGHACSGATARANVGDLYICLPARGPF